MLSIARIQIICNHTVSWSRVLGIAIGTINEVMVGRRTHWIWTLLADQLVHFDSNLTEGKRGNCEICYYLRMCERSNSCSTRKPSLVLNLFNNLPRVPLQECLVKCHRPKINRTWWKVCKVNTSMAHTSHPYDSFPHSIVTIYFCQYFL